MSTIEQHDVAADLEEVIRMIPHGGVKDPELIRRIQERTAKIRATLSPTNIAVELIRETRDEQVRLSSLSKSTMPNAKAERRGVIQPGQGRQLLTDVLYTPPDLHPSLPLLSKAYSLASAARVGVYDCLYIALAEQQQCKLLSADDRLQRTFPQHVVPLASLP